MKRLVPILLLLLVPGIGQGYEVLTASESGAPVHWHLPVVGVEIERQGSPFDAETFDALFLSSAELWQQGPCNAPRIVVQGDVQEPSFLVDGHNRFLWMDIGWPGTPGEIALTKVTRDQSTGEIVDVDMLFNTQDFQFSLNGEVDPPWLPIAPVLTHEIGHLYGLGHSSEPDSIMEAYVEESLPAVPFLSDDDRMGMCSLYEKTRLEKPSEDEEGLGPFAPGSPLLPPLFLLALLILWREENIFPRTYQVFALGLVLASCHGDTAPHKTSDTENPGEEGASGVGADSEEDGSSKPSLRLENPTEALLQTAWKTTAWVVPPRFEGDERAPVEDDQERLWLFSQSGEFRQIHTATDGTQTCPHQGAWWIEDNELVIEEEIGHLFCPTSPDTIVHRYRLWETDGGLSAEWLGGNWGLGSTTDTWAPHTMEWEQVPYPDGAPPCEPPAPCTLLCGNAEDMANGTPGFFSCALKPDDCTSVDGDTVVCTSGCSEIICTGNSESFECDSGELSCVGPSPEED